MRKCDNKNLSTTKNKHNVKLATLYDSARQRTLLLCCAKFKVTARRFCLLDANALGAAASI